MSIFVDHSNLEKEIKEYKRDHFSLFCTRVQKSQQRR